MHASSKRARRHHHRIEFHSRLRGSSMRIPADHPVHEAQDKVPVGVVAFVVAVHAWKVRGQGEKVSQFE